MVHDPRESIFTNFDWGQGTWDACTLQSLVRNYKDSLNYALIGNRTLWLGVVLD